LLQNEVEEQKTAYARPTTPAHYPAETAGVETPATTALGTPTMEEPAATTGLAPAMEPPAMEEEKAGQSSDLVEQPDVATGEPAVAEKPEITGNTEESPHTGEAILPAEPVSFPPTAADSLLQNLEKARSLRQILVKMNEVPGGMDEASPVGEVTPVSEASPVGEARSVEGMSSVKDESPANEMSPAHEASAVEGTPPVNETGPAAESSPAMVSPAMALAEPIVEFEPYHTIDYFASVGIKLVQDENPSDKLGKQLKSFTDWLKVMRKLPQKNQEIIPDVAAEHQIQAIAAHSIKGKEILTETMAEVLVKQGMREKAVDVYHKLSLLNPDKSAYFATKIEQLKID
jgi:hypothetical protein